jgi:hypothetical protein
MLDNLFGINTSEVEARYVSGRLRAVCSEMPTTTKLANLSSYDHNGKIFVLHTGRRDVLVVTKDSLTHQINGYGGLVFPWIMGNNVILPHYNTEVVWEDILFGGCLDNLITIPSAEAQAVLKVWLLTVLLRDGLTSRPILALFGAPGSGKSTLFRRVYRFLYGAQRGLNTISNEDNFDQALASDPLVVLDNVDSYASWLPDRLAATVAPTEITKRKLYTDSETVVLRRDAMIGITAHNPKFGREDVTDRMLLLTFERLSNFESDSDILGRIDKLRNALWGSVLKDIQKVLATPMPSYGFPQFRVRDFAVYGYWIATALGISEEFYEGITKIKNDQRSFNLEEDQLLIDAIDRLMDSIPIDELTAGQLWTKLRQKTTDERSFTRRYLNAVSLGKKLWTLLDSMREIYDIHVDIKNTKRVWTIKKKVGEGYAATV